MLSDELKGKTFENQSQDDPLEGYGSKQKRDDPSPTSVQTQYCLPDPSLDSICDSDNSGDSEVEVEYPASPTSDDYAEGYAYHQRELEIYLEERQKLNADKDFVKQQAEQRHDKYNPIDYPECVNPICIDDHSSHWKENAEGYLNDYEESMFDASKCTDEELVKCCHSRKPDENEVKVLRKYLEDVYDSKGFCISNFPGNFYPMTDIFPCKSIFEKGEKSKEFQDMMSLTEMAIKRYNNEKDTNFEVEQVV